MTISFRCLLCAWMLLFCGICEPSFAQDSASASKIWIERIEILGLSRTKLSVVEREIPFESDAWVTVEQIESSIQKIRNLQIFARVVYELKGSERDPRGWVLQVYIEEKWTTIPIFKVSSGGGVQQAIVGVYDPNVLGSLLEFGGQYERLGQTNSGVVWFRNPRIRVGPSNQDRSAIDPRPTSVGLDFWSVSRLKTNYEDSGASPAIESVYLQNRRRAHGFLGFELIKDFELKVSVEGFSDERSTSGLDPKLAKDSASLGPGISATLSGVDLRLGRLDHEIELVEGVEAVWTYRQCREVKGSPCRFRRHELDLRYFGTFGRRNTAGLRLAAGSTNTKQDHELFRVGGFDRLRGFEDGRFRGTDWLLWNSEVRVGVWHSPAVVIQQVSFLDAAVIAKGNPWSGLRNSWNDEILRGSSIGLGLRLISPKVYRLAIRADFAHIVQGSGGVPFSFGVQQFF